MNANKKRTSKARTRAAVGLVLAAVAVVGSAMVSAQAADRTGGPSEMESLSVIRQNSPAVARAIADDNELRSVVGAEKWPLALHGLAEFSKNADPDYKEVLRIIGDTVTRVKNPVAEIKLDGDPSEWSGSLPPASSMRLATRLPAEVWKNGAAAVVRQDRLYLMAGVADATQYFARRGNDLHLCIDCQGDRCWDVYLSISMRNGAWLIRLMPADFEGRESKTLSVTQGVVGTAAEFSIAIREFVPVAEAKPIWTLHLEAVSRDRKDRPHYKRARDIAVFNENARQGVAAWPYVRTFVCLCADKPIEGLELTAAAIAIMSSTMYMYGDEEVRRKIREDNAEFLEFAREVDAWQSQAGTQYRLKTYPLEAQLGWAARIRQDNHGFLEKGREPGKRNSLENYHWVSTSIGTLRKLRTVALREGLADTSVGISGQKIDRWAWNIQEWSFEPEYHEKKNEGETDPKKIEVNNKMAARARELQAEAEVVGSYRGKPVSSFGMHHSETQLQQIERHGHYVGTCGAHTHFSTDLMRALGIASHRFRVVSARIKLGDHAWPAWYDPSRNLWLAYQRGRHDKQWWYFFIDRRPVFYYAAETEEFPMTRLNTGPRPFPLVFCRELQGTEVQKTSQRTGIPTKEVREWMLTPCF